MLIVGDISGIQDFLFDVRETGGKQAASLRFRSLRLQLIVECIARRVLWSLELPEQPHLLFCAAGKFQIEGPSDPEIGSKLDRIRASIDSALLAETHGRLRCAISAHAGGSTAAGQNDGVSHMLQRAKLSTLGSTAWKDRLIVPMIFDKDVENEHDKRLDELIRRQNTTSVELSADAPDSDPCYVGVGIRFRSEPHEPPRIGRSAFPLSRVARHIPMKLDERSNRKIPVWFTELAARSRGAPMLGVLKADADNLGTAIRKRLGSSSTFQPLVNFSQMLETFFGQMLQREMEHRDSRWNSIYTVFAGGDDLLLVGPWDVIIDFASHVREMFIREFKADELTISAGCAIVKPKFPIHLAADQAEALLEQAKTATKDQFAMLGDVWKWEEHPKVIDAGKQVADWVDGGDIQRGWLHTLLELALLRRGESPGRDASMPPAMATSRLSYHVARNWPKPNAPGEKGRTRQWVDTVVRHFDTYENSKDPVTRHLPAILRYAMLASRAKGDPE